MHQQGPDTSPLDAVHGPEVGGGPILDQESFAALQELAGEDDPGLVAELVGLFIADARERMAQIESALDSQDIDAIGAAAHALKSSSANIGALQFSRACAALELRARQPEESEEQDLGGLVRRAVRMYTELSGALHMLTDEA